MILNKRFVFISPLITLMLCSGASALNTGIKTSSDSLVRLKAKDKTGFMDKKGKVVIEPKFFRADGFSDGLSTAYKNTRTCGYIDKTGEYVIPAIYTGCFNFNEGLASVMFFLDKNGEIFHPGGEFEDTAEYLQKNNLSYASGFINKKGELIYKTKYDEMVSPFFSDDLGRITFDNKASEPRFKTVFINKKGKKVLSPKEYATRDFSEGLAVFSKNDKSGYINKQNKVVIKPDYEQAGLFSEGLAPVKVKELFGYIDKKGKIVIKPQFERAYPFYDGLARISVSNKMGFIDKKGKIVIKPVYEEATNFSDGIALVKVNNLNSYINKKGEVDKALQKTFDFYNK